jgi:hypothetical protein
MTKLLIAEKPLNAIALTNVILLFKPNNMMLISSNIAEVKIKRRSRKEYFEANAISKSMKFDARVIVVISKYMTQTGFLNPWCK